MRRDDGHHEPAAAPDIAGGVQAGERDQRDLDRGVRHERGLAEEVLRQPDDRSDHVDGGGDEQHSRDHAQPRGQSVLGALPRVLLGGRRPHRSLGLHH